MTMTAMATPTPLLTAILLAFIAFFVIIDPASAIETNIDQLVGDSLGPCHADQADGKPCSVDGHVGSTIIYEDEQVRVWNFTLAPGEMTSMHKHDYDYHFVTIKPTQLEVWGEDGSRLFDFRAEGVLGFKVVGDFLEPIGIELPFPVPVIHAAKNIGPDDYYEILFESKLSPKRKKRLWRKCAQPVLQFLQTLTGKTAR